MQTFIRIAEMHMAATVGITLATTVGIALATAFLGGIGAKREAARIGGADNDGDVCGQELATGARAQRQRRQQR